MKVVGVVPLDKNWRPVLEKGGEMNQDIIATDLGKHLAEPTEIREECD